MNDAAPTSTRVKTPSGDVLIQGRIHARWLALKGVSTPDGDDVQAHLEHPLGEQEVIGEGGGTAQLFRRGMLVERPDGRTFVVYGAIYDHYLAIGGAASAIGMPISDEQSAPFGGRVAHFERGDIYWRQDFGPREIRDPGRRRYAAGANPFTRSWLDRAAGFCKRSIRRVLGRRPA
jgi:uncharacterized protein with LGFP repeats